MKKKNINLLLILLGVVILLVGYLMVYRPTVEKTDAVNQEREALMPELHTLQDYYSHLDQYYDGIEESQRIIKEETERYAADVRNEDLIMYAMDAEARTGILVNTIRFNGMRQLLSYPTVNEEGKTTEGNTRYVWQNGMSFECDMDYDQMKALIDFINLSDPRYSLEALKISFASDTGILSGTADINGYFINGSDYTYEETRIPGIAIGNNNLFASQSAEATGKLNEQTASELEQSGVIVLD